MTELRDMTAEELDVEWNRRSARNDEAGCAACEAEYERRRNEPAELARLRYEQRRKMPFVLDLEKRFAVRVGMARQMPTARIDFGNRSEPGEKEPTP